MPSITTARRLGAALLTAAALAGAASSPAAAAPGAVCDTRLDRLEAQFYAMADRHGYDAASEWWNARWAAYHTSCVV